MSKSNARFGNCRRRKGATAEETSGAKRLFLGLRKICAELSSKLDGALTWGNEISVPCVAMTWGFILWE